MFFLLFAWAAVFSGCVFGQIRTADDLKPIFEATQSLDSHALVVFDVHDVLTMPKDQILKKPYKYLFKEALQQIADVDGEKEATSLENIVKKKHTVMLVDPAIISLLATLQERGVRALALTNARAGDSEGWVREDLLISRLQSLGIDLSGSFPSLSCLSLEDSEVSSRAGSLLFVKGVIFTSQTPKGLVLKEFLRKSGFCPSQIIFVDDKVTNLESVQTFCTEAGIPFIGFQYTAVEKQGTDVLDKKRAQLQLQVLKSEQRWIDDEEATQMLNTTTDSHCCSSRVR